MFSLLPSYSISLGLLSLTIRKIRRQQAIPKPFSYKNKRTSVSFYVYHSSFSVQRACPRKRIYKKSFLLYTTFVCNLVKPSHHSSYLILANLTSTPPNDEPLPHAPPHRPLRPADPHEAPRSRELEGPTHASPAALRVRRPLADMTGKASVPICRAARNLECQSSVAQDVLQPLGGLDTSFAALHLSETSFSLMLVILDVCNRDILKLLL